MISEGLPERKALTEIGMRLAAALSTRGKLDAYKKQKGQWSEYEKRFLDLMISRRIEETISRETIDGACLLCSEGKPDHCHRRLVAQYIKNKWGDLNIVHL